MEKKPQSLYTSFMGTEIARLRAENPGIEHKTIFKMAVKNWKESKGFSNGLPPRKVGDVSTIE